MTVLDETNNMKKYKYLDYIEFLDMFCRIVIVGIIMDDTIEYKAHLMLEILYKKLLSEGMIDKEEFPLMPPEDNLRS